MSENKSEAQSQRLIGPKATKRSLEYAIKKRKAVFLHGAPGLGKSDIVRQIGLETNREVIDVRLALWDPTDLKGVLYYNPEKGEAVWSAPPDLPSDPDSNAILFLDELSTAPQAVQASAYQLVLDRRVGTYVLPKGVDIIAAGNREGDRGVSHRIPAPLANRFTHLDITHNFEDWEEWALQNKVHPEVISYLGFAKNDLYDAKGAKTALAFASPRSWVTVSDYLWDEDVIEPSILHNLVSGAIGDGLGIKFMAHRKIAGQLPKPSDILNGIEHNLNVKEISAMYSLSISMCYELKEMLDSSVDNWADKFNNYFNYISKNFPVEIVVMGVQLALIKYRFSISKDMKNWDEFQLKYGKYITTALAG